MLEASNVAASVEVSLLESVEVSILDSVEVSLLESVELKVSSSGSVVLGTDVAELDVSHCDTMKYPLGHLEYFEQHVCVLFLSHCCACADGI